MRLQVLLLALACRQAIAKIFDKCELAHLLETKHGMTRVDVQDWVCIAEHESTFNTEAVNKFNWDGSRDYGLFQLSDKFWCDDHTGKNVCKTPCSAFLDDDLTDDLACVRRIIKDTEAWKGKGTGLTAWVAYVNRCQGQDLKTNVAECYDGTYPVPTEIRPDDNIIPRLPEEHPSTSTSPSVPSSSPSVPSSSPSVPSTPPSVPSSSPSVPSSSVPPNTPVENNEIVNSARVPYPSHHELVVPEHVSRSGAVAVHVGSDKTALFSALLRSGGERPAVGKSLELSQPASFLVPQQYSGHVFYRTFSPMYYVII
ncbi:uncharacterized protein LOC108668285 isoform X1 [Hyalella azteca]|uniref:Uncharacterized protein LOC108668285 isoform X1 n=1 Tax=Hyalella azteca TaxID=294128 RepID=A0A8B7NBJ6_HYAAZ|nr:uncharacterized protein LOC108668285 isoform X1 [Hyalella azteca]